MCDICNSIFGHASGCPEHSSNSGIYCFSCENELDSDEIIATFPNGLTFCRECVRDFDLSDLCENLDVDNAFELIEKFELCEVDRIGRWQ